MELTILMPCLNEAETLEACIQKAKHFLNTNQINGEVLISDNGSTDGSIEIAKKNEAKVVDVSEKGYGNALITGINNASGKFCIMGDSDDSYDFSELNLFVSELRNGADLVMGNRFKGGIKKNAMPFLHRYLGNPVLSFLGRLFFKSSIRDFHCGLRGFSVSKMKNLELSCTGMEFASEMVVKSVLNNLKIVEVPTILYPDGRSRPPHLRTWRDGWRHLRFLLIFSPKWLFLIPGITLSFLGTLTTIILYFTSVNFTYFELDIHTMVFTSMIAILGFQLFHFYLFTSFYTFKFNLNPILRHNKLFIFFENYGITLGILFFLFGFYLFFDLLYDWKKNNFGPIVNPIYSIKLSIISFFAIIIGFQTIFNSFFLGLLNIKIKLKNK